MRHPVHGPRIIVKDDRDSTVGRGGVLFAALFRPEIAILPRLVAACAPMRAEVVRVTEGHRKIRETRDRHEDLCALDFTIEMPAGMRAIEPEYEQVADRMRIFLGPDYDIVVHGEGLGLHIHVEWDPKG